MDRIVAWPDAGEFCGMVTVAVVEVPAATEYPEVLESCAFRSSCNNPSSAPAVAVDSALNAAATPYPVSMADAAKNAMRRPPIEMIPPINITNAKNVCPLSRDGYSTYLLYPF